MLSFREQDWRQASNKFDDIISIICGDKKFIQPEYSRNSGSNSKINFGTFWRVFEIQIGN